MRPIENLVELKTNKFKIDEYLTLSKDPEYSFAINLIKNGICFVVFKSGNSYKFYPSRFMGYANNRMNDHNANVHRDGRETNSIITEILSNSPRPSIELNNLYIKYCEILGFVANDSGVFGVERKYWNVIIDA